MIAINTIRNVKIVIISIMRKILNLLPQLIFRLSIEFFCYNFIKFTVDSNDFICIAEEVYRNENRRFHSDEIPSCPHIENKRFQRCEFPILHQIVHVS